MLGNINAIQFCSNGNVFLFFLLIFPGDLLCICSKWLRQKVLWLWHMSICVCVWVIKKGGMRESRVNLMDAGGPTTCSMLLSSESLIHRRQSFMVIYYIYSTTCSDFSFSGRPDKLFYPFKFFVYLLSPFLHPSIYSVSCADHTHMKTHENENI